MKALLTILVVAVLLCIVLSSEESDVLQCTGEKLSDGQFYFNMPYEVKKDDCETQWIVDEKVAGISDAKGNMEYIIPVVNLTVNEAILHTCPEKLEYRLLCPIANINKKLLCSCDGSPPTTHPEVGFPNWNIYIWIGVGAFAVLVIVIVTVIAVLYRKRQRSGYVLSGQGSAEKIV